MPFFSPLAISPYNRLRAGGSGGAPAFSGLLDDFPSATAAYSFRRLSLDWKKPSVGDFSFGNALYFAGTSDQNISIPDITLSDFTLNVWFTYFNSAFFNCLIGDNGSATRIDISSQTSINFANPGGTTTFSVPSITQGAWNMLTVRRSGSDVSLFLNGTQVGATQTGASNSFVFNQIGKYAGSTVLNYKGSLDELSIYNTAISNTDITDLFNGGEGDFATNYQPDNLQAYWRMNQSGAAITAIDETGNYNGTLNNFPSSGMWVAGNNNKGRIVEIRRLSDFTSNVFYYDDNNELSLTSKDSEGITLGAWIGSGSGSVKTWFDQSGNDVDISMPTSSYQPIIISLGTLVPNKMIFNGSYNRLTSVPTIFGTYTQPSTFFTVSNNESAAGGTNRVLFDGDGTNAQSNVLNHNNIAFAGTSLTGTGDFGLNKRLTSVLFNDLSSVIWQDSIQIGAGAAGANPISGITLGATYNVSAGNFWNGSIEEIIFYNADKSADRAGIETNINNFYRIYGGAAFSFGNALKFDGANDFVSPNTNLSNENDVSLSCWMNVETTSHNYNVLLANSTGAQYFGVRIVSGLIRFTGFGIFNSLNTNNTFIENTWFHIGVIQSGNSVSYYYNGVLQGTVGGASKRSDIDLIGKYGGAAGSGLKLKGLLDEYVLWDSALSDLQMKNQYNLGAGNFADADVTPLVYYSCNQADGTTPLDNDGSGGSSYNGTLENFATPYFVPHTPYTDADAAAIISQMATNGSTPSYARQIIINQLVLDLKGLGNTGSGDIWSILDVMQIYAAEDSTQAKTEWIKADGSLDAIEVNTPTFSADVGYTGSGNPAGSIDTSYQPTTDGVNYALNSASMGGYIIVGYNKYFMGIDENPNRIWIRNDDDGAIDTALNSSFNSSGSFSKKENYLATITRSNSSEFKLWTDNSLSSTKTQVSTVVPSIYTVRFLGVNRANPILAAGASGSLFFAGGDLSAHVPQLSNSFNAYLNSI